MAFDLIGWIPPVRSANCSSIVVDDKDAINAAIRLVCEELIYNRNNNLPIVTHPCRCYLTDDVIINATWSPEVTPDDDVISDTSSIVLTVLYVITIATAALGNGAVVGLFALRRRLRTAANAFLFSLTISDLLITIFCMPFNALLVRRTFWDFGDVSAAACKLVPYMQTVAVTSGIFTLVVIALERFAAVLFPLRIKQLHMADNATLAVVVLVALWIASALYAIPNALWFEYHPNIIRFVLQEIGDGRLDGILDDVTLFNDTFEFTLAPTCRIGSDFSDAFDAYRLSFLILLFVLPFLVTTSLYVVVVQRLWSRRNMSGATLQSSRVRLYKRITLMLILIQTLFVICWAPTLFYETWVSYAEAEVTEWTLNTRYYLQWLAMSHSCCNPFVYVFLHEKFRQQLTCFDTCLITGGNRVAPAPPHLHMTHTSSQITTSVDEANRRANTKTTDTTALKR